MKEHPLHPALNRNECNCRACLDERKVLYWDRGMILCPICGNKRCPHATDHRNKCSGSNAPGQIGSDYGLTTETPI